MLGGRKIYIRAIKNPLLLLQGAENATNLEQDKRITHIRFFDGGLPKTILRLRQPD